MKTILFVLVVTLSTASFSQAYENVVQMPGKNASEMFAKSLEWFAINFVSANDVIQLADDKNFRLVGKGTTEAVSVVKSMNVSLTVYFTLNVQFRDGRYKFIINSTKITPHEGNFVYTYELLQQVATENGLREYYKEMKIKKWMVSDDEFYKNLESNKAFLFVVDNEIKSVIDSLHSFLMSDDDNW